MALYSADTTYIGKKRFTDLRRACVSALVGHWHSASPVISCNFFSRYLMDPFLHTLCQCARIIRRLANTAHEVAVNTVKAMVEYSGSRPFGPASTFKVYLNQVGWTIEANGDIAGPDHFRCNMLKDHCTKIVNVFKQMLTFSILTLTDRKGVGDFLPDPALSIRFFSKLQDDEQQLVKLNVAGGYQTDSMKAKRDDKVNGNCDLCGLLDTREHRLLECEAMTEVRKEWEEVCQTVPQSRPGWVYLPIPRQHPDALLLRAWTQLIKEPPTPDIVTMDDNHCRFFTDGGAINPQIASARVASWAVIQDVATSHAERKTSLDYAFGPEPHFPAFKTTALGLVPGDQNVSRAALFAILIVLRSLHKFAPDATAEMVTDASYVCLVIRAIENRVWQRISHRIPNVDIIEEIDQLWQADRFRILKVKSHVSFEQATSYEDLWKFVGNHCADLAATSVLETIPSDIKLLVDALANHVRTEEKMFGNFLKYLIQFNRCRLQKLHDFKKEQGTPSTQLQHARAAPQPVIGVFDSRLMGIEACNFLKSFGPDNFVPIPKIEVGDDLFQLCLQGANLGKALKSGLDTLKWPTDVIEKVPSDWGMSWFEMAVSFYSATGFQFPVRISGATFRTEVMTLCSFQAIIALPLYKDFVLDT